MLTFHVQVPPPPPSPMKFGPVGSGRFGGAQQHSPTQRNPPPPQYNQTCTRRPLGSEGDGGGSSDLSPPDTPASPQLQQQNGDAGARAGGVLY